MARIILDQEGHSGPYDSRDTAKDEIGTAPSESLDQS
jgi:hypothetical protein